MAKAAYTARSPSGTHGELPTGWDSAYDYPDVNYDPFPTTPWNGGIPNFPFPVGFPGGAGNATITVDAPASMAIATAAANIDFWVKDNGGSGAAYVNHLIEIVATVLVSGANIPIKLGNGAFQTAIWLKVKKYEQATPKYGAYERIAFDLTGLTETDDVLITATIRTLNGVSGTDTIDLTGGSS